MSESSKVVVAHPLQHIKLLIIVIVTIALLLLGYAGGYFILPGMIRSAYGDADCASVLARNDLYSGAYPFAVTNKEDANIIQECAIYTLAMTSEESKSWQDSYNAFSVYSETYPDGLFKNVIPEHSANVLMALINEDVEQGNFSEASTRLDYVLDNYKDTSIVADAEKLKFDLHLALGRDRRETGDFAGAEKIFQEYFLQAQEGQRAEDVKSSLLELAQTNLDWGLELQSQENFAGAQAKFEIAISLDPDSSAASGPTAKAKASLAGLYIQWGDYLIAYNDFANAMQLYKTAATFFESGDSSSAKDVIAEGYVRWADELINQDDFLGGLVLLDFAQASSDTDATKKLVDSARSDLLFAFSRSDGKQAQKAIENAVQIVCNHQTPPKPPIFGLDPDNISAGVEGAGQRLPDSIAAKTPASLHFVACVEEDSRIVGTLTLPISAVMFGGPPGVLQITYANRQYIWNVVLREINTGEIVGESVITGEEPAALVDYQLDLRTFNYFGAKPKIADLADWILTVIN